LEIKNVSCKKGVKRLITMRRGIYCWMRFGFYFLIQIGHAQVPGKICPWQDDKKGAVVLTFDDWTPGQFPIATPELKSRNMNATFFIITNNVASWNYPWPDVLVEITNGNEIGNHTYTHPYLSQLNTWATTAPIPPYPDLTSQITREVGGAKKTLEQNISTQQILTFAYPFGDFNTQVVDSVIADGHICARGVIPPSNFSYDFAVNPSDYYNLNTFPMSTSVSLNSFFGQIQNVINGGGLLTFLYHSLDNGTEYNDNWYSQVQQSAFEQQLDTLASVKNQVWITTLMQAIKYHKEKRCASLSQISLNNSQWILNLTDTLSNNAVYNQPLSLKLYTNGVTYGSIMQNGVSIKIDSESNDTIMFRAVPDAGLITLTVGTYTALKASGSETKDIVISPIPTNGVLTIKTTCLFSSPTITFFDAMGRKVYQERMQSQTDSYTIDMAGYDAGVYYLQLTSLEGTFVKKVIVSN
jgi:peptidoglycan/xylan/chitin deacetylase (PgdA/CDA1 family)